MLFYVLDEETKLLFTSFVVRSRVGNVDNSDLDRLVPRLVVIIPS